MTLKGNTIILLKNGIIVAALVTQDITASADRIAIAGATQGQWEEYVAGQKKWEVSAGWLVSNGGQLTDDMLQTGETFVLTFLNREMPTDSVFGRATLKTCDVRATKGNLVQGNFKFEGTDELNLYAGTSGDFNFDFNSDFLI